LGYTAKGRRKKRKRRKRKVEKEALTVVPLSSSGRW
jgi:hypothetical protein